MADYISKFEAEEIDVLLQKVKDGDSGGSGIIEVPELPTSNIDENANYKVVVNEAATVYVRQNGTYTTAEQFVLATFGIAETQIHWVDELPADMLKFNTGDSVIHLYFINSTAIGYLWISMLTNPIPLGQLAFSSPTADKGYTDDITLETEDGVYVQIGKHSEDWFYRESGEWVRITPEQEAKTFTLTAPVKTTIMPEEGKVFSSVTVNVGFKSIGDFVDRYTTIEKITENDLTKTDGKTLTYIREYAFAYAKVKSITLPPTVTMISGDAFNHAEVEEVTFKGRPSALANSLFDTCANLKTLNVSWGNAQLSGAPWGATNATINYNYTGE